MEEYKLKSGNTLRVIHDSNAESPDTWENKDVFLVYDHREFTIKREGFEPRALYDYLQFCSENKKLGEELFSKFGKYYIFPVAAYIHGDITLKLTDSFAVEGFDTSVTGFVLVEKKRESRTGVFYATEEQAKKWAEGLIETWNVYLSGEIYGFRVLKKQDIAERLTALIIEQFDATKYLDEQGRSFTQTMVQDVLSKNLDTSSIELEELDACWGFYGSDPRKNGMMYYIDDEIID